ncbi:LacI family DNA-binding transcriptional regulator [Kushneria indalinina]|uniref:LacI family transcriptional regulator n=1 Tax=Kushneria indalinina DSM 14324 TaxID=1122140 RepID=A0A3D9DSB6_9GAMM|nr:LacI family DNA-binding transcriptional regulator [Kushneria indalinina]REC93606.1 LacI family transcriptional regulator [Kushneria indalinina DSM 14324]
MPPSGKPVTLKDLAAHAGVSRSTVSLVLQESPLVAKSTRERVMAAVRTLGYVYNRGAATLRSARTHTIGVVVHDIANPFFGAMVAGIDETLQNADYVSFLASTGDSPERQQRLINRLREQRIDALLLCPAENTPETLLDTLERWGLPCIEVMRHVGASPRGHYVGADIRAGMIRAVTHLAGQGHRHIALLTGPGHSSADRDRMAGFQAAMEDAGLVPDIRTGRGELTRRAGLERTLEIMSEATPPTALICHNDLMALGALLALARLGLTPGVDCAVIGIDDSDEAALSEPALSSIATHPHAIGSAAAELALACLDHPGGEPQRLVLDTSLHLRASADHCLHRSREPS